jgi:hypothetical protein
MSNILILAKTQNELTLLYLTLIFFLILATASTVLCYFSSGFAAHFTFFAKLKKVASTSNCELRMTKENGGNSRDDVIGHPDL